MLKKDGERITLTLSVKKTTKQTLEKVAAENNRPIGRQLDEIVENAIKKA
ncbi:MAG: hypothetical protein LBP26_04665 [Clostridiales bacterium]|jgi:hypothetical protein|nr:hypothetical protein [Clostridiales bacterium]